MAAGGQGYFHGNFFHDNYWHDEYWLESATAAPEIILVTLTELPAIFAWAELKPELLFDELKAGYDLKETP